MKYSVVRVMLFLFAGAFSASAHSISCDQKTNEELFKEAKYVAHIKVTVAALRDFKELRNEIPDYEEWREQNPEYVRVSFEEIEVFKVVGQKPRYLREAVYFSIASTPGKEYVVYLNDDSLSVINWCTAVINVTDAAEDDIASTLRSLRTLADRQ